ncbi:hypothetical protein DWB68_15070 [Galactobacter valiniphilus]|uniref:Uncharacterized protein n=1 Tax=Galactobacter valiniphilus TaxID=2676122 RepID=A0A399J692_9MICC|nr:hypothetical protein [Galactobacter valiniphilus]RII40968.1 hypothetical protein DWB68_15070 [Galactobacter valiniphilus]
MKAFDIIGELRRGSSRAYAEAADELEERALEVCAETLRRLHPDARRVVFSLNGGNLDPDRILDAGGNKVWSRAAERNPEAEDTFEEIGDILNDLGDGRFEYDENFERDGLSLDLLASSGTASWDELSSARQRFASVQALDSALALRGLAAHVQDVVPGAVGLSMYRVMGEVYATPRHAVAANDSAIQIPAEEMDAIGDMLVDESNSLHLGSREFATSGSDERGMGVVLNFERLPDNVRLLEMASAAGL